MKPYPDYNDSGVEWIGEIPSGWNKTRLKYYSSYKNGYAFKSDGYTEDGIPVIRIGDIKPIIDLSNCKKVSFEISESMDAFRILKDDILIALTGATIGKSGVYNLETPSLLNQRVAIVNGSNGFNQKLISYIFVTDQFREYVFLQCEGGAQENIGTSEIGEFEIPLPLIKEQQQISTYLDHKTQKIDTLIEKTQQKIELLKEQRTSLINHIVTKGLNPDVEMKDSGVEWIGKIPSGWEVPKLNYIVHKITDGEHISPKFTEMGVPFLSSKDVRETGVDINVDKYVSVEDSVKMRKRCNPEFGDVLVVGRGNSIGRISIVDTNEIFCLLGSVILIKQKESNVYNKHLFYYLQSIRVFEELINTSSHSVQPTIYLEGIKRLSIVLPPIQEQQQIVEYLDKHTGKIDTTIEKESQRIELLKEYRQSLISEVVTGKIDVRDEVAA